MNGTELYLWAAIAVSWGWIAWLKYRVDQANQYAEIVAAYIRMQSGRGKR